MHLKKYIKYCFNHEEYLQEKNLKKEIKIKQKVGLRFLEKKLSEGCDANSFQIFVKRAGFRLNEKGKLIPLEGEVF